MGNMGSLKQYLLRSSNAFYHIKKAPYQMKKSMENIENKIPPYVEGSLAVLSGVFSAASFIFALSYFTPRNTQVQVPSSGNPYLDALIGLGFAGASAAFVYRTQTRLDPREKFV